MKILGIDPGYNGALAVLKLELIDGKLIYDIKVTPKLLKEDLTFLDPIKTRDWIKSQEFDFVYLENVHALFGSGAKNTFNFGRMFGGIEGIVGGLGIECNLVTPKTWQKEVWLPGLFDIKKDVMTAKEKSAKTIKTLFPNLNISMKTLFPELRIRKDYDHDGVIDAILIALYGFKQNKFDFGGVLPPYTCSLIEQEATRG